MIKAAERIILGNTIKKSYGLCRSIEEYNGLIASFDMTTIEPCNSWYAGYCEPTFELMEDELAIIDRFDKTFIGAVSFEETE